MNYFSKRKSSHSTVFLEGLLREFELSLLQGMGYGVDLVREAETNKKIKKDLRYSFNPDLGFLEVKKPNLYKAIPINIRPLTLQNP